MKFSMCYQNVVGSINLLDTGRRLIGIRFEVVSKPQITSKDPPQAD